MRSWKYFQYPKGECVSCGLTFNSSRSRFAAWLNSGVRPRSRALKSHARDISKSMSNHRYVRAKLGPWSPPGWFDRLLAALHFPKSDQRFLSVAGRITDWWLELNEMHQPQREIGFDSHANALFITPYRADITIFLNMGCTPEEVLGSVDAASFERE